LLKDDESN